MNVQVLIPKKMSGYKKIKVYCKMAHRSLKIYDWSVDELTDKRVFDWYELSELYPDDLDFFVVGEPLDSSFEKVWNPS